MICSLHYMYMTVNLRQDVSTDLTIMPPLKHYNYRMCQKPDHAS